MAKNLQPIPVSAAESIAKSYDYDQVVIIARAIDRGESVVTYGKDKENCLVAARIGQFLQGKVMGWDKEYVLSDDEIAKTILRKKE